MRVDRKRGYGCASVRGVAAGEVGDPSDRVSTNGPPAPGPRGESRGRGGEAALVAEPGDPGRALLGLFSGARRAPMPCGLGAGHRAVAWGSATRERPEKSTVAILAQGAREVALAMAP